MPAGAKAKSYPGGADSMLTHVRASASSPAYAQRQERESPYPSPMKKLLPLLATAALLAGCADDSSNPWSTEVERADSRVQNAAQTPPDIVVGTPTAETPKASQDKYSWQKKKAEETKPEAAPAALAADKAIIVAIRGDAGLIQIKRTAPSAAGDKLVLTKDGKALQIVVHSVEGESVIADISARQLNTPALAVGDEVSCAAPEPKESA